MLQVLLQNNELFELLYISELQELLHNSDLQDLLHKILGYLSSQLNSLLAAESNSYIKCYLNINSVPQDVPSDWE
jgi:hypothetical protein